MTSPICEVKNGASAYVSTLNGVNVTPGETVTIRLLDSSARTWSISCVYTDDQSVAATVTSSLVIDPIARTATFTAPVAGRAYIFRSVVNNGVGPDGRVVSEYSATFGVYTLTTSGQRVLAVNETTEGDATFGWTKAVNSVVRSGGAGGVVAVADDIAKSGGAAIDRVQGIRGTPIENVSPTNGRTLVKRGTQYVFDKPVPPGWYDPRDYGAVCDGETDDLPAYQAMLTAMPASGGVVHLPPGVSWMSDTWRVDKAIQLIGPAGGNRRFNCGFEFAPGRAGIQLESIAISEAGTSSAQSASILGVDLKSQMLIHHSATGNALGRGLHNEWNSRPVRKGDCVVASASAYPTRFFRCTDTGHGTGTVTLTTEPTWAGHTTPGDTFVHEGATFVCEAIPTVRANSTAYALGDRVYAVNDNRFYWTCTQAGTTDATPPLEFAGGDEARGVTIGDEITDGTAKWVSYLPTGVLIAADLCTVERLYIAGFMGPGLSNVGGDGMFAAGMSFADNTKVRDVFIEYCGLGAYYAGSDANGWLNDGLFVINAGTLQPTPDESLAANYTGLAGHCFHDVTLASGSLTNLYCQTSTGRTILKNGIGRLTVISGFDELGASGRALFSGGCTTIIGGTIYPDAAGAHAGLIQIDITGAGRGITETTSLSGTTGTAALARDFALFPFSNPTADPVNYWGWKYGFGTPAGYWGLQHGNQGLRNAFLLSDSAAGLGVCPGWLCFQSGYLLGNPSVTTPLFFGHSNAQTDGGLRGGFRKIGDRFVSTTSIRRLTSDGWRGPAWTANTAGISSGYAPFGIPAYVVEPTTNTGTSAGGEKVFQCTTDGTTGATEPDWSGATTIGDTVADNGIVWTLVGFTPSYEDEDASAWRGTNATISDSPTESVIATTAATAVASKTLTAGSITTLHFVATVKKSGTDLGGLWAGKVTYSRPLAGAPSIIGAASYETPQENTGDSFAFAVNGNDIEVKITAADGTSRNVTCELRAQEQR